jgi:hypothetical protein
MMTSSCDGVIVQERERRRKMEEDAEKLREANERLKAIRAGRKP